MKPIYIQLGVAIVIFVVCVAALGFEYMQLTSLSSKVGELAQDLKDKSQTSTRLARAKAQLDELAPQEASINQYFVSSGDIVPFLEQFSSLGKFLGSHVDVISVSATPGSPYGTLSLALKVTGSYQSVMRTLGAIEYGPYDIKTNSVSLDWSPANSSDGQTGSSVWTASVSLGIGMQPESKTKPVPATTVPAAPSHATSSAPVSTTTSPSVVS